MYIVHYYFQQIRQFLVVITIWKINMKFRLCRNYHLRPTTKGVYPVQLTDKDYVNFHCQNFMQNGIYKNHFFGYEDLHAKYRTRRSDISTGWHH